MPTSLSKRCEVLLLSVLVVTAGCTREGPVAPAASREGVTPAERGWVVNVAEPEEDEGEPGAVVLMRRADGGEADRPRLAIGCVEGETEAYIEWGTPLGRGKEIGVDIALEGEPPRVFQWQMSDDHEAAGLWADSVSVPFIRSLLGHDRITARLTPEGQAPLMSTFTLASLDTLVTQVRQECGWG